MILYYKNEKTKWERVNVRSAFDNTNTIIIDFYKRGIIVDEERKIELKKATIIIRLDALFISGFCRRKDISEKERQGLYRAVQFEFKVKPLTKVP